MPVLHARAACPCCCLVAAGDAGGHHRSAGSARVRHPLVEVTVESGADPAPEGPAAFPTGWFASRDRAYQWLAG